MKCQHYQAPNSQLPAYDNTFSQKENSPQHEGCLDASFNFLTGPMRNQSILLANS